MMYDGYYEGNTTSKETIRINQYKKEYDDLESKPCSLEYYIAYRKIEHLNSQEDSKEREVMSSTVEAISFLELADKIIRKKFNKNSYANPNHRLKDISKYISTQFTNVDKKALDKKIKRTYRIYSNSFYNLLLFCFLSSICSLLIIFNIDFDIVSIDELLILAFCIGVCFILIHISVIEIFSKCLRLLIEK